MVKFKVIPEMICSVDPKNFNKQDSTGAYKVIVKSIVGKRKPFGLTKWKCINFDTSGPIEEITIIEKLLYPANMSILRLQTDVPIVDSRDIDCLDMILNKYHSFTEKELSDIKALREKLLFYKSMREI